MTSELVQKIRIIDEIHSGVPLDAIARERGMAPRALWDYAGTYRFPEANESPNHLLSMLYGFLKDLSPESAHSDSVWGLHTLYACEVACNLDILLDERFVDTRRVNVLRIEAVLRLGQDVVRCMGFQETISELGRFYKAPHLHAPVCRLLRTHDAKLVPECAGMSSMRIGVLFPPILVMDMLRNVGRNASAVVRGAFEPEISSYDILDHLAREETAPPPPPPSTDTAEGSVPRFAQGFEEPAIVPVVPKELMPKNKYHAWEFMKKVPIEDAYVPTRCCVDGCDKLGSVEGRCVGFNCGRARCSDHANADAIWYHCAACKVRCLAASMYVHTSPYQIGVCGVKMLDSEERKALVYMRDSRNVPCRIESPAAEKFRWARVTYVDTWVLDSTQECGFKPHTPYTRHLEGAKCPKFGTQMGFFHRLLDALVNPEAPPNKRNPFVVPRTLEIGNLKFMKKHPMVIGKGPFVSLVHENK
jgi:hypothetical protein